MSTADRPVDWDATTYDRVAGPQEEWGLEVLERLPLRGDETVLDAGCGSGRLTRHLLERLADGRVIGVDASPSMIELSRERFAGDPRVELICADLTELEVREPVDAVFSGATFHWIADHDLLFARLRAALREGGRLTAQCGGEGNVQKWKEAIDQVESEPPFAEHLAEMPPATNFASVGETRERLHRAGFRVERVWLEPKDVRPDDPLAFTRSVGLAKQLARLPDELRERFVEAVTDRMGKPLELLYIRLNIDAVAT